MNPEKVFSIHTIRQTSIFYAVLANNFSLANVSHFSQQIRNQRKILHCFDTYIQILWRKFLGHISTFLKPQSQIRKKRLKIVKNMFYESVSELLYTPTLYNHEPLSFSKKNIVIDLPFPSWPAQNTVKKDHSFSSPQPGWH